jgi:hypothetical protein
MRRLVELFATDDGFVLNPWRDFLLLSALLTINYYFPKKQRAGAANIGTATMILAAGGAL